MELAIKPPCRALSPRAPFTSYQFCIIRPLCARPASSNAIHPSSDITLRPTKIFKRFLSLIPVTTSRLGKITCKRGWGSTIASHQRGFITLSAPIRSIITLRTGSAKSLRHRAAFATMSGDKEVKQPSTAVNGNGDVSHEVKKPCFVGSVDQGTTSTRFLIFNLSGEPVASHQMPFNNRHPHSGWHEHDALEILESVEICIEKAAAQFEQKGYSVADIRSIGITNQRETTVLWDKNTGEPLCNAVVWPDTRTAPLVRELKSRDGAEKLQDLCGLPLSTYPSSVKLLWLLRNDEAVKKAYDEGRLAFGTVDTWLIYRLNGGAERDGGPIFVTDPSNASRTMFMNIRTLDYDDQLLSFFELDRSKIALPKIVKSSCSKAYGSLAGGPLKNVPIAGCLGDQSSALVGQLGLKPGHAKNTYGTGCFLLYNTGEEPVISKSGLLTTVAFDFSNSGRKPVYALEGSVAVGGSGITFLQNNLGIIRTSKEVDDVALTVSDNGGVYFVTAFSGLFAPYWIDDAKGTLFGVTQHTQKGHIARATLEATCYQTSAILSAMSHDSGNHLTSLAVDGGLSNSDLCMQTQADISGIEVDRPAMRETTALGAAIAAGLATGVWENPEELADVNLEGRKVFKPQWDENQRKKAKIKWNRAVEMSRGWVREEDD